MVFKARRFDEITLGMCLSRKKPSGAETLGTSTVHSGRHDVSTRREGGKEQTSRLRRLEVIL